MAVWLWICCLESECGGPGTGPPGVLAVDLAVIEGAWPLFFVCLLYSALRAKLLAEEVIVEGHPIQGSGCTCPWSKADCPGTGCGCPGSESGCDLLLVVHLAVQAKAGCPGRLGGGSGFWQRIRCCSIEWPGRPGGGPFLWQRIRFSRSGLHSFASFCGFMPMVGACPSTLSCTVAKVAGV